MVTDLRLYVPVKNKGEIYRLYTYSLVHGSDVHYAINMMCLFFYGTIVEIVNQIENPKWISGFSRTLGIQSFSIIAGAFAVVFENKITGFKGGVVGASGGIYGLLASLFGYLFLNWKDIEKIYRIFMCLTVFSALLCDILVNVIIPLEGVSYGAHVGGFIGGIMSGTLLMYNMIKERYENNTKIFMFLLMCGYTTAGLITYLV
jgi:membrane associated rhomboid family serine protease